MVRLKGTGHNPQLKISPFKSIKIRHDILPIEKGECLEKADLRKSKWPLGLNRERQFTELKINFSIEKSDIEVLLIPDGAFDSVVRADMLSYCNNWPLFL